MIKELFGPSSLAYTLRQGLDASMARHREIARKVASSLASSSQAAEGTSPQSDAGGTEELVQNMAALADTQIRYEAEAALLRVVYEQLRRSFRSNG